MFLLGSAYPTAKLGINASMPPILFGAIRMIIVFICLLPFLKFKLPNKKYLLPLFGFAFSMGAGVNLFLYLSVNASSILSPIVIGAQLSVPLAIIFSSIFIKESISLKPCPTCINHASYIESSALSHKRIKGVRKI